MLHLPKNTNDRLNLQRPAARLRGAASSPNILSLVNSIALCVCQLLHLLLSSSSIRRVPENVFETMTETAPSFPYTPLAPGEIRLLILGRGLSNDPVWCILVHRHLAKANYEALSYEWGMESKDDPDVIVNGRAVRIRKNLYEALKQIRQTDEERYLWVDALCIDQADLDEKSQQIGLMGDIFGGATCVIAWLGVARDDSDIAMEWMAKTNELEENLRRSAWDSPERKAIELLCYRSYWRRVWIIQELYLARTHVVRCGTKSISGDQFENSLPILNRFGSDWEKIFRNPADHHRLRRENRGDIPSGVKYNKLHAWLKA